MQEALSIEFTVFGNPKAQKRHRTDTHDRFGNLLRFPRQRDPSKTDKADFLAQIIQHRPNAPWTGPIEIKVRWVMPRPKSHYGTGKNAGEIKPGKPLYCTSKKRSDSDNLIKLIMDAMNGIFFLDDSQIAVVHTVKVYDHVIPETPRTEVFLMQLPRGEPQ